MQPTRDAVAKRSAGGLHLWWGASSTSGPRCRARPAGGPVDFFPRRAKRVEKRSMGAKPAVQVATCWGGPQEKKKKSRSEAECFFFSCGGQSPGRRAASAHDEGECWSPRSGDATQFFFSRARQCHAEKKLCCKAIPPRRAPQAQDGPPRTPTAGWGSAGVFATAKTRRQRLRAALRPPKPAQVMEHHRSVSPESCFGKVPLSRQFSEITFRWRAKRRHEVEPAAKPARHKKTGAMAPVFSAWRGDYSAGGISFRSLST